jgi:hypothetical protein
MARLLILVEGETEETFVNEVLAPHLYDRGFLSVTAKLMGNARDRSRRGGIRGWPSIRDEIIGHLTEDREKYVALMADYYALPGSATSPKGWPGRSQATNLPLHEKATYIEGQLQSDISEKSKIADCSQRFLPYIMMHEFEALLFSDCESFATSVGQRSLTAKLQAIRDKFLSPEAINDSPETHPSKRIQELLPSYQKPLYGNVGVLAIGLPTLRRECPGFDRWLGQLESLIGGKADRF